MLLFSVIVGLILALIPNVLWVIFWCVGKIAHFYTPYTPFGWSSLALLLIFWALMAYGYYIGCTAPFRLGAPQEITLIRLSNTPR